MEYDLEVRYIPGKVNQAAHALFRVEVGLPESEAEVFDILFVQEGVQSPRQEIVLRDLDAIRSAQHQDSLWGEMMRLPVPVLEFLVGHVGMMKTLERLQVTGQGCIRT